MVGSFRPSPARRCCRAEPCAPNAAAASAPRPSSWEQTNHGVHALGTFPFRWNRNGALNSYFDAFSLREPLSTSLENAPDRRARRLALDQCEMAKRDKFLLHPFRETQPTAWTRAQLPTKMRPVRNLYHDKYNAKMHGSLSQAVAAAGLARDMVNQRVGCLILNVAAGCRWGRRH
jgi:hypothetical protein